jgi:hypothetical protein
MTRPEISTGDCVSCVHLPANRQPDVSDDGKVIDIYEWTRPLKPGELPMGCTLVELSTPTQPETNERPRKMRPSELALAITLVVLISLLIASYIYSAIMALINRASPVHMSRTKFPQRRQQ